ncbi:hypothetical protein [Pseudomonas sp. ESBL9]|uniref:hypothetical protein n=1 Tax=Pseudomonas sp. ESBL9 TaxID=3077327 RepID=UPI002FCA92E1
MRVSPNTKLCQQHCPGGLRVGWDALCDDQRFSFLARVLQLDLFTWPGAVVANPAGNAPLQWLAGLSTAYDDGVVALKALLESLVVVRR